MLLKLYPSCHTLIVDSSSLPSSVRHPAVFHSLLKAVLYVCRFTVFPSARFIGGYRCAVVEDGELKGVATETDDWFGRVAFSFRALLVEGKILGWVIVLNGSSEGLDAGLFFLIPIRSTLQTCWSIHISRSD